MKAQETQEGRERIEAELARYRAWCEQHGIPWTRERVLEEAEA